MPAIRDLCEALPTGSMAKVCPGHFRLLKIWNASRICVSTLWRGHANLLCIVPILIYRSHFNICAGPCQSSLYRCNFNICVAVANTITQSYISINKILSLARQPLLAVALNCRSFAPSPGYQFAAKDACSRSWLDVT